MSVSGKDTREKQVNRCDDHLREQTNIPIKKQYKKPVLQHFGDVRDVTMGGTINPGDSGGGLLPF